MQLTYESFIKIKKSFKNYIKVILSLLFNKKMINVILNDGKTYNWNNIQVRNYIIAYNMKIKYSKNLELFPDLDKLEMVYNGNKLKFFGFLEDGWIYHEFINFEYYNLNFINQTVIDVGANSGATSIFFALNGAKYVYAIEPMPKTYSILKSNIELNNLDNKIIPLNYGIGKSAIINLDRYISGQGADINSAITKNGKAIEIKTLKYIIENYKLGKCVLKMDCEGCEYDAILSLDGNDLQHFDEIMMEYHYGSENLKNFLEGNGFSVTCSNQTNSYNHVSKTKMVSGLLYAKRNNK